MSSDRGPQEPPYQAPTSGRRPRRLGHPAEYSSWLVFWQHGRPTRSERGLQEPPPQAPTRSEDVDVEPGVSRVFLGNTDAQVAPIEAIKSRFFKVSPGDTDKRLAPNEAIKSHATRAPQMGEDGKIRRPAPPLAVAHSNRIPVQLQLAGFWKIGLARVRVMSTARYL
ncbi:hypothetical protein CONPUDRAFT_77633 [Coniophora puteana RWD-64-598 SS2]|uniref:Uncharacterized protein n=1 Tax=Coniophora puteana (strain RWD-64-598) TaxID=741705 RepID=A0A5M3M5Z6_CONPW|nr:uncharacterized protein CONPUDRAFT_77633 [Coniophora puteana RWD-64-598 SS2]EIW74798.1 hypothetical protein CONPUDRAFT_77633 [Coniophora puteana RWD-64-598 SS2]